MKSYHLRLGPTAILLAGMLPLTGCMHDGTHVEHPPLSVVALTSDTSVPPIAEPRRVASPTPVPQNTEQPTPPAQISEDKTAGNLGAVHGRG